MEIGARKRKGRKGSSGFCKGRGSTSSGHSKGFRGGKWAHARQGVKENGVLVTMAARVGEGNGGGSLVGRCSVGGVVAAEGE